MSILDDLLASLNVDSPVRNILVGVHWTVVCSRHCGMASTMKEHAHGHTQVRGVGSLLKKTACELAEHAHSDNLLEASIGLAAINSMLAIDETQAAEINAREVLIERGRGKKVALVGHFPFVPKVREAVGQLWVIEQRPSEDDYSEEAAADLIPQADVVAITGTTLINHTLDDLLALCQPGALVMVIGPTTPIGCSSLTYPLLFNYGVDILSGSKVFDESAVVRTVSQGASFQQVEGVRRLTFVKNFQPS